MSRDKTKEACCANCGYKFRADDEYNNFCPNCGQKNHNPRSPLLDYIFELVEDFFNYDNKTWVTLRTIVFQPGIITKDHIKNKRARYTPPFKLFMFSLALFIGSLEFAQESMMKRDVINSDTRSLQSQIESLPDTTLITFSDPFFTGSKTCFSVIQLRQLKDLEPSKIGAWLQTNRKHSWFIERMQARMIQVNIRSMGSIQTYNRDVVRIAYAVIIIMIPIAAFFIFLIFHRKGLLYYDTLIMAIHLNAFALIFAVAISVIIIFLIETGLFIDVTIILPIVMATSLIINFTPAFIKVFEMKWTSTLIRTMIVACLYMISQILIYWVIAGYVW